MAKKQTIHGDHNNVAGGDITINNNVMQTRLPMTLGKFLPQLSELADRVQSDEKSGTRIPFDIEQKILHNDLKTFKSIVGSYGEYCSQIDSIYDALGDSDPRSKSKVLSYIQSLYWGCKSEILASNNGKDEMSVIRANSDLIIETVKKKIVEELKESLLDDNISIEDIYMAAIVTVCHGFISCRILERPS